MSELVIDPELRLVDGTLIQTIADARAYLTVRTDLGPEWARLAGHLSRVHTQQDAVDAANELKALLNEENLLDTGAEEV